MNNSLSTLFESLSTKRLNIANRMVMAPMTRYLSPGYVPPKEAAEYYAKRVRGGVGLIITEATIIDEPHATAYEDVPGMFGDAAREAWKEVVDAVHEAGGKIFCQLWHTGAIRKPGVGPSPDLPSLSPSGVLMPGVPAGSVMSQSDIDAVIASFTRAAKMAVSIGFDGIEIHGAHGYLVDQFLWEGTNQRDDLYGGSISARNRFAVEIVRDMRKAVGDTIPISFRFSQWKQQDYSARLANNPEELEQILVPLAEAGVDIFHASTRRFWDPEFPGSTLNLAGWAKKLTGKLSITVGSVCLDSDFVRDGDEFQTLMKNFDGAQPADQQELLEGVGQLMSGSAGVADLQGLEERLEGGEFDMVALGRSLLANPNLPELIKKEDWKNIKPYSAEVLAALL